MSGNNERDGKKIGSRTPTDAIEYSAGTIGPSRACKRQAHIYRRSTAVLSPKESFIARDAASGQASWDVEDSGLSFERALPTPACPSPAIAPRTPVLVRQVDAQSRPGAGCKSARGHRPRPAIRDCLPDRVRLGEIRSYM